MERIAFSELILGAVPRSCAYTGCKELTYWVRPRQKTKGYCLTHATGGDVEFRDVFNAAVDLFSDVSATSDDPPWLAPGEYARWVLVDVAVTWPNRGRPYTDRHQAWALPLDAGPCRDCRAVIRAYGDQARPYCALCATQRGLRT